MTKIMPRKKRFKPKNPHSITAKDLGVVPVEQLAEEYKLGKRAIGYNIQTALAKLHGGVKESDKDTRDELHRFPEATKDALVSLLKIHVWADAHPEEAAAAGIDPIALMDEMGAGSPVELSLPSHHIAAWQDSPWREAMGFPSLGTPYSERDSGGRLHITCDAKVIGSSCPTGPLNAAEGWVARQLLADGRMAVMPSEDGGGVAVTKRWLPAYLATLPVAPERRATALATAATAEKQRLFRVRPQASGFIKITPLA